MRELTKTSGQRALPVAMSTGLMFDLFAATGSIISVWTGKMCDHFGPNTTPILSGRSFLLDLLAAGLSGSLLATVALQAVAGITSGDAFPAVAALLSSVSNQDQQGTAFGLENSARAAARTNPQL